jgi:hypothetical protein
LCAHTTLKLAFSFADTDAGAKVVRRGAPVYPGAMFLPGCAMHHQAGIFELLVPCLPAGPAVTEQDIIALGHGGFCAYCAGCRYLVCHFGKA